MSDTATDSEERAFRQLMEWREGCRHTVYLDTRGLPTVGIGHLVQPEDNLSVGDRISDDQVNRFFAADSAAALDAACRQAEQAGITCPDFIPCLASVNFQLGTGWTQEFPHTWAAIMAGDYGTAASMLDGTLWQKQTPVRVADFQQALRQLSTKAS